MFEKMVKQVDTILRFVSSLLEFLFHVIFSLERPSDFIYSGIQGSMCAFRSRMRKQKIESTSPSFPVRTHDPRRTCVAVECKRANEEWRLRAPRMKFHRREIVRGVLCL